MQSAFFWIEPWQGDIVTGANYPPIILLFAQAILLSRDRTLLRSSGSENFSTLISKG